MMHRLPRIELLGVFLVVVAVVVAQETSEKLWITALAAFLTASALAFWRHGIEKRQQAKTFEIQRAMESEIEDWQQRWSRLVQESELTLSALALMRDGVIILSDRLEIQLANPMARRLLGLSAEQDLIGRLFGEVVRNPEVTEAVGAARSGDGIQNWMFEIHDGERVRPLNAQVAKYASGSNPYLLITLRDETEARRVDEMRREFVANISHELKTPLAAIKGYAETVELAIKDDPDAAAHFMNQIHSQCLRLERLTADMMQLARAQSGRSNLKIGSVSMSDVFAESLKSYKPLAEAKQIELTISVPESTLRVWSDPEATLTIANNLIGNAINYTPPGGHVCVSCRQAGNFTAMVVEDTGVGISEEEQTRIFERFYRVQRGRHSGDGGTGIGLSIVKNLAMTLGGEVRLTSKPGKGSKFEVLLPREIAPQHESVHN